MEKLKEDIEELGRVDPIEWHNIPKPIVQAVAILKSSSKSQFAFLEYFHKHFQDFEARCNLRIINVQKSIAECLEKIKENDESFKILLKTSDQKSKESLEALSAKVSQDFSYEKSITFKQLEEIRQTLSACIQRASACPSVAQIQSMLSESSEQTREKTKEEVFENLITPEVDLLNQKLLCINM